MKQLFIETVGCQMNMLDSEMVVASLRKEGYQLIDDPLKADVVLFNTCSVRQHAEDKVYSALGKLRRHKQKHPEQIIGVLREQEAGAATADVCRKHGISGATFYKWKAKFGGMDVSEARRLKVLEDENAKLKRLLAEAMLDNAMLKDLTTKKF